jgi:hypothetical protein
MTNKRGPHGLSVNFASFYDNWYCRFCCVSLLLLSPVDCLFIVVVVERASMFMEVEMCFVWYDDRGSVLVYNNLLVTSVIVVGRCDDEGFDWSY